MLEKYRKASRIFVSIQLCAMRLYGRFLVEVNELSPRIVNYINTQLGLPPSLTIVTPKREATLQIVIFTVASPVGRIHKRQDTGLGIWTVAQGRARIPV